MPPSLTLASISAEEVTADKNPLGCALQGSQRFDLLTLALQNPGHIPLDGATIRREGSSQTLATLAHCNYDSCDARLEAPGFAFPPGGVRACVLSETSRGDAVIRLIDQRWFQPSDTYRLLVATPQATSNVAEATVVRLPGADNDTLALISATTRVTQVTGGYSASVDLWFYCPYSVLLRDPELLRQGPDDLEAEIGFFVGDKLLAALRWSGVRSTLPAQRLKADSGVLAAPPRVMVTLRHTVGATPSGGADECSFDPRIGPPCPIASTGGTVVWEKSQDITNTP